MSHFCKVENCQEMGKIEDFAYSFIFDSYSQQITSRNRLNLIHYLCAYLQFYVQFIFIFKKHPKYVIRELDSVYLESNSLLAPHPSN